MFLRNSIVTKSLASFTSKFFISSMGAEVGAAIDPCQRLNNTLKSQIGFKHSRKNLTPLPTNYIERFQKSLEKNKKPIVLLNTGAYCPPHFGHFDSLVNAKNFLEKSFNFDVLAIYMSPAQDSYLKYKAQKQGFEKFNLNLKERLDMLEWTKENYKDQCEIIIDKWEGNQPLFIHFPNVWVSLQYYLEKTLRDSGLPPSIKVGYCIGDDMLQTQIDLTYKFLRLDRLTYELPLIIYGREGVTSKAVQERLDRHKALSLKEMEQNNLYYVPNSEKENCTSSTLVRSIVDKDYTNTLLGKFLHPKCIGYLRGRMSAMALRNQTEPAFPKISSLKLDTQ